MTLRKVHALSAVLIAAFACLHIANHLAGLLGVASHIAFMGVARSIYRFPPVEVALLSCVAFQIISGLTFVIRGWKQRHGLVPWLQAISGAYLSFFLVVHVGAVSFGRAMLNLNTNFYFAAAGFHVAPFQFFFFPYYFLAVVALFTHLGCAAYWQARDRPRTARLLVVAVPAAVGAVVAEDKAAKRLNITLTDTAYAEVTALSKTTRRSITELVRLGLALVKISIEETGNKNILVIVSPDGRALKEIVLPSL